MGGSGITSAAVSLATRRLLNATLTLGSPLLTMKPKEPPDSALSVKVLSH